jgi:hypothetical protein
VSRPDPSGADQSDAEHQATDLAVGGSNPSRRATNSAGQRAHDRVAGCPVVPLKLRSRRLAWCSGVQSVDWLVAGGLRRGRRGAPGYSEPRQSVR